MYIRCKNCHDSIWIRPGESETGAARCGRCGQRYHVHLSGDAEAACEAISRKAGELAQAHGLDLPSAYSVVLGIATHDEMAELHAAGKYEARRRAAEAASPAQAGPKFDAAFRPAVDAGLLTADEAYRRGTREAYAKRLMERHRLPLDLAHAVTDNRLSLLEALHGRAPQAPVSIRIERPERVSGRILLYAAILVAILLTAGLRWWAREEQSATAGRARVRLGTAEVFTDDAGRIVRVVGASPEDVLATYCRQARAGARLEPTGVVPTSVAAAVRIGVLQAQGADQVQAIPIRVDTSTGRWYAGDGLRPLEPRTAPEGALEAVARR
jgi:hypothetical protein